MRVTLDDAIKARETEVPDSGQVSVGKDLAGETVRVAVEIVDESEDEQ